MKHLKLIGLLVLICLAFFYTDELIEVSLDKDPLMDSIKEYANINNIPPQNALIDNKTIIAGSNGLYIDELTSYKAMKKIGYFIPTLLTYKELYPKISIYNNYNKYIISGNQSKKNVSLVYILSNINNINDINNIIITYHIQLNIFVDYSNLLKTINDINHDNTNIYNYGNNGKYTKENLLLGNNIINNKTNNSSNICLFTKEDESSLNNCANHKMHSILLNKDDYFQIKTSLKNGQIFLINNIKELPNIIEYIKSKGYTITTLDNTIKEAN